MKKSSPFFLSKELQKKKYLLRKLFASQIKTARSEFRLCGGDEGFAPSTRANFWKSLIKTFARGCPCDGGRPFSRCNYPSLPRWGRWREATDEVLHADAPSRERLGYYVRKPSSFFLSKELQKEPKTAFKRISPLRRRRGLRALDPRKLLEKFDQNFRKRVSVW